MSLISLLIMIVVIGLVLYLIGILPIQPPFKTAAYVIAVLIFIIWLLQAAGIYTFH